MLPLLVLRLVVRLMEGEVMSDMVLVDKGKWEKLESELDAYLIDQGDYAKLLKTYDELNPTPAGDVLAMLKRLRCLIVEFGNKYLLGAPMNTWDARLHEQTGKSTLDLDALIKKLEGE